eukprot:gene26765-32205_t
MVSYFVSAIFVGFYEASFVENLGLLAVIFTYTFTVGLVSILANRVFGKTAIMIVMLLMIFLNFPSAGAAFPADFLPGFWSGLSHFWIGAGAMDAARSIVYFGSTGIGHGLLILGGWLLLTVVLLVLTHLRKPTPTTSPTPRRTRPRHSAARNTFGRHSEARGGTVRTSTLFCTTSARGTLMNRLAGKKIVITGAASGIGRAAAELMVTEGASVLIADLDGDAASNTAAETS